jgi:hypothetical protein
MDAPAALDRLSRTSIEGKTAMKPELCASKVLPLVLVVAGLALLAACNDAPITPSTALEASARPADRAFAGPFPSDRYTVPDPSQQTGRRVELPFPDCTVQVTDCEDVAVLNTLDGFNLQPRISIPFAAAIDLGSVSSRSIFLVELGGVAPGSRASGRRIGINQIVWDPGTNMLHAESDQLLEQHTRYALIVTGAVRGADGRPARVAGEFGPSNVPPSGDDPTTVGEVMRSAGVPADAGAAATIFTTQSTTTILEQIRDQVASGAGSADFALGPSGSRTVFERQNVSGITWGRQMTVGGALQNSVLAVALLDLVPGAVGRIAFGRFRSADYMAHPGEYIPPVSTGTGVAAVRSWNDIYFNLFLPSGEMPAGGWPVAILGHGSGGGKDPFPLGIAATMAEARLATIIINAVGHGFGAASTLTVSLTDGSSVTFTSGGRGIDQNGDGSIGAQEGIEAAVPRSVLRDRDGLRQTVIDLMQLVSVIQAGVDVDGDGSRELDPLRIYYAGHSLGGMYGAPFFALDARVQAAVLNVPVALQAVRGAWSPVFRASRGTWLSQRIPSLINSPGLTQIGGVGVGSPLFNDNLPLPDEPIRVNDVAGAMEIQQAFDNMEWAAMSGDALAYMPHLRKAPLDGVPARPILVQFATGDQNVPNPITSMMLRAGDLADVTTQYRHDLAWNSALPKNGHTFMTSSGNLAFRPIALGAQRQIATFFSSGGAQIIHPEPQGFFQVPTQLPFPETFNYIR